MIHENDKLVIPEKIRAMSVAELRQEKEKIQKTLPEKKTSDTKKKLAGCTIAFNL